MTTTTMPAVVAVLDAAARTIAHTSNHTCDDRTDGTGDANASRTDAHTLRQAAALARMAAATLATVPAVTRRADGAATLAALWQAAGDCEGYSHSVGSEARA